MNVTLAPIFCLLQVQSCIIHHASSQAWCGAVFPRRAQIYNHRRSTTVTIFGRHVITLTGSWVYFNRMLVACPLLTTMSSGCFSWCPLLMIWKFQITESKSEVSNDHQISLCKLLDN